MLLCFITADKSVENYNYERAGKLQKRPFLPVVFDGIDVVEPDSVIFYFHRLAVNVSSIWGGILYGLLPFSGFAIGI